MLSFIFSPVGCLKCSQQRAQRPPSLGKLLLRHCGESEQIVIHRGNFFAVSENSATERVVIIRNEAFTPAASAAGMARLTLRVATAAPPLSE